MRAVFIVANECNVTMLILRCCMFRYCMFNANGWLNMRILCKGKTWQQYSVYKEGDGQAQPYVSLPAPFLYPTSPAKSALHFSAMNAPNGCLTSHPFEVRIRGKCPLKPNAVWTVEWFDARQQARAWEKKQTAYATSSNKTDTQQL